MNQIRIIGVEFDGNPALATGTGVNIPQQVISTVIQGCTFWGCDKHGIHAISPVGLCITGNNFLKGNAADNFYDDIRIESGAIAPSGVVVVGNTHVIDVSRTNKGYAIREFDGGSGNPNRNTYIGNTITGTDGTGTIKYYQQTPIRSLGANNCVFGNSGIGYTFQHSFNAAALAASRVLLTDTNGNPVTLGGMRYILENGVVKQVIVGESTQPGVGLIRTDSGSSYLAGYLISTDDVVTWEILRQNGARNLLFRARDVGGVVIDDWCDVTNPAGGDIYFGKAGRPLRFGGPHKLKINTRTGDATTSATANSVVRYTGTGGHTETLPAATGTGVVFEFRHSGSGVWTISRAGSDVIDNGVPATPVTSITPAIGTTVRIIDAASGRWEVL